MRRWVVSQPSERRRGLRDRLPRGPPGARWQCQAATEALQRPNRRTITTVLIHQIGATSRRKYDTSTVRGLRDDAEAERTRLLRDLDTGSYVEPSRMTVEDGLLKWLDSARMSVAPKTIERYEEIVRKHLIPALKKYFQ